MEFSAHGDWAAASHSLQLDDSHGQGTLDLVPPSVLSVPFLAPARIISVHVSAPARVHFLPVVFPSRFSALGLPQDEATVQVDICNRAGHLVIVLEESMDFLLVNAHSPWQFLVPTATGPVPILKTPPRSPICSGLTLRLDHHPEHGISSPPEE